MDRRRGNPDFDPALFIACIRNCGSGNNHGKTIQESSISHAKNNPDTGRTPGPRFSQVAIMIKEPHVGWVNDSDLTEWIRGNVFSSLTASELDGAGSIRVLDQWIQGKQISSDVGVERHF